MDEPKIVETLLPAIKYAEEGVVVSPRVSFDWQMHSGKFSSIAKDYYLPDTHDVDKAWEYAALACKTTQNFNRSHPDRMDLSNVESKLSRIKLIHPFEDFFQDFFDSVEALVKVLLDGGIQSFDF